MDIDDELFQLRSFSFPIREKSVCVFSLSSHLRFAVALVIAVGEREHTHMTSAVGGGRGGEGDPKKKNKLGRLREFYTVSVQNADNGGIQNLKPF